MPFSRHNAGMCLIAFHWQPDGATPLRVAANRDEFYARPTAPMQWWEGERLLAGRDLQAGGTWLGVTTSGRLAALTNHREPALVKTDGPSRGGLPLAFLRGTASAEAFLDSLRPAAGSYSPFNLLVFDGQDLRGYESRTDRVIAFAPGLHAVSNGAFDEPWPKVQAIQAAWAEPDLDDAALLALLADEQWGAEEHLPHTGVSLDWERVLSPVFIRTPTYGTRASTLLRLGMDKVTVVERRFTLDGLEGQNSFAFRRG